MAPIVKRMLPEDEESLLRSLREGDFSAGAYLGQSRERKRFGHWGNFKDYVEGAVGMSERQAYRLIAGYEIDQLLRRNSCRPHPANVKSGRSPS